jgi:perosamine synthetase
MVTFGAPAIKGLIDSERNQGRAPNTAWLDHIRLGFNYRLSELACALGLAQLERLDRTLLERRLLATFYRHALGEIEGLTLPNADEGGVQRSWFVFTVQMPGEVSRDEIMRVLAAHGVQSKPYLPAIHLMSFYREHFGYGEGDFPVCEDVAARSLALPFFVGMKQQDVERVADVVARSLPPW